jgi:hypothetical protein
MEEPFLAERTSSLFSGTDIEDLGEPGFLSVPPVLSLLLSPERHGPLIYPSIDLANSDSGAKFRRVEASRSINRGTG